MATTISASNGSTSGLISTGDASGILQLQVNNGTPSLTLNTTQALGVGTSPSYGTSGQFLQSTGSGSAPTWATPATGAMTLISTLTASSSASLAWTGLSGYDKYQLIFNNLTSGGTIYIQVGTGSTTYVTSGYADFIKYQSNSSTITGAYVASDSQWSAYNSSSTNTMNGFLLFNGFLGGVDTNGVGSLVFDSATPAASNVSYLLPSNTTAKTAIKITASAGSLVSGSVSLYGISS